MTYVMLTTFNKANKVIGLIRRLYKDLFRKSLLTIYKSNVRPHLDYGDIIYDRPNNDSFVKKLESVQYNAALAITGAIRGTSKDRIYQELGLESLSDRRWYHRLCLFWKIVNGKTTFNKANKVIGLIRRLYKDLFRKSLLTIYKSNVRPHLDYGDIIYDRPNNDSFVS